jgi:hypothetical protein
MERDVVRVIVQNLKRLITEEAVKSTIERYGDIGGDLLTYAVAFDVGVSMMPTVHEASRVYHRQAVNDLVDEVDDLRDKLKQANIASQAIIQSQTSAATRSSTDHEQSIVVEANESFLGALSARLAEKYAKN